MLQPPGDSPAAIATKATLTRTSLAVVAARGLSRWRQLRLPVIPSVAPQRAVEGLPHVVIPSVAPQREVEGLPRCHPERSAAARSRGKRLARCTVTASARPVELDHAPRSAVVASLLLTSSRFSPSMVPALVQTISLHTSCGCDNATLRFASLDCASLRSG